VQNAEKLRKAAMHTNRGKKAKALTTTEAAVREAEEALNAHRARLTSQHAPASQYGTQRTRQQGGRMAELIAAEKCRESDDEGGGQESGSSGSGSPGGNNEWDEPGDSDESMSSATEGEQGSSEAEVDADNGDKKRGRKRRRVAVGPDAARKAAAKAQRLKSAEEYGQACLRDDGKTKQDCVDATDQLEKLVKGRPRNL